MGPESNPWLGKTLANVSPAPLCTRATSGLFALRWTPFTLAVIFTWSTGAGITPNCRKPLDRQA